jgi:mevalonate kinase
MPRKIGRACGKIILSGNTANRFGKRALAVPVDMYITAIWDNSDNTQEGLRIIWAGHSEGGVWLTTVRKIIKSIEAQIGRVSGKLTFRNALPLGKGMGSSTALVVALARCFLGKNCKKEALAIEDFINKGHSGLDFAVIWEERPIVIQGNKYEFTEVPKGLQRGVLVDTGVPTAPTSILIRRLKERFMREKVLMDSVETIGNCTERLLSGEDPLTVFPDHYKGLVNMGVVPPRVRSLIEKIQRSGGAAKPGRFGGATGGVGMMFAVHPKVNILTKIVGSAPVLLVYDSSRFRFIIAPQDRSQNLPEPLRAVRIRSKRTSVTPRLGRVS